MIYFMMINDHWACFGKKKRIRLNVSSLQCCDSSLLSAGLVALSVLEKAEVKCADTQTCTHKRSISIETEHLFHSNKAVTALIRRSHSQLWTCGLGAPQFVFPVSYSSSVPTPTTESDFPQLSVFQTHIFLTVLPSPACLPAYKSHLGLRPLGRYSTVTSPTCKKKKAFSP